VVQARRVDEQTVRSSLPERADAAHDVAGAALCDGRVGQGCALGTGRPGVLIGTIWIAVGSSDNIVTYKIEEDNGRERNLESATNKAIHILLDYLKENCPKED